MFGGLSFCTFQWSTRLNVVYQFALVVGVRLIYHCFLPWCWIWAGFICWILLNISGYSILIFRRILAFTSFVYQRNVIISVVKISNLFPLLINLLLIRHFFWRCLGYIYFPFLHPRRTKLLLLRILTTFICGHALLDEGLEFVCKSVVLPRFRLLPFLTVYLFKLV